MKILNYFSNIGILLILAMGTISISCTESNDDDLAIFEPSASEKATLLRMLEEEKLARDVYTTLYGQWGSNQFDNIKESEQRHMNYISNLLTDFNITYQISDPGVFINSELQQLYNQFIQKGSISEKDALEVGATIEDLDIKDLQNALSATHKESIISVYEKLLCGSKNHMRAFNKGLKKNDTIYTPIHISQTELDEILAGSNSHCG